MVRTLSAALRTIVLVPLFFFYTLERAAHVLRVGKRNPDSPKIEQTLQTWARLFLRIPPIEMTVEGREHVETNQRYVVVSNHISNFDIPVLFRSIPTPIRFLAKKELYKIPFFGPGMDVAGIVKVDRSGSRSTHQAINEAARETYQRGYSLLVFAEGTRSRTGEMADFHTGAVRIARDNNADLLPVVISGSFDINPPGSKLIYPGRVRVRILPPVPSTNIEQGDIRKVTNQLRKDMGEVYEELRSAEY
ncbi:MAG: lysophospholipid acyltransferase family protein [Actinomycetota bacterium]|nr:lysophospholipid acyltransferase family protein [Actinomycetota bacterium]